MKKKENIKKLFALLLIFCWAEACFSQSDNAPSAFPPVSLNKNGFCFGRLDTLNPVDIAQSTKAYVLDVDMDGKKDLLINKYFVTSFSGVVDFHKGTPAGNFIPSTSTLSITGLNGIKDFCVADFNNDGAPDVATVDEAGKVWFFKNLSSGSFAFSAPSYSISVTGTGIHPTIETADVNSDGWPDILIAQPGSGPGIPITILKSTITNSTSPFTFTTLSSVLALPTFTAYNKPILRVGFFDTNNFPDIVIAERGIAGRMEVYYNTGTTNFFNSSASYTTNLIGGINEIKVRKLNGDNIDDISALVRGASIGVNFLMSLGSQSSGFTSAPSYTVASNINNSSFDFDINDFNNDNLIDLCIADSSNRFLKVVKGVSSAPPYFSGGSGDVINLSVLGSTNPFKINSVDIEGNGFQDLVIYGSHLFSFRTVSILNHSYSPTITVSGFVCSCRNAVLTASINGGFSYSWSPGGGTVAGNNYSVTLAGTYAAIASYNLPTGGSCTVLSTPAVVSATAGPSIKALVSPGNSLCSGNSFAIQSTGTYGYLLINTVQTQTTVVPTSTISFPPMIASGNGLTTYSVVGFDINQCCDTVTVSVQVNPKPTTNICANCSPTICAGQPINIYVIPNMSNCTFTWMPMNVGGGTITVSPTVSSSYYVAFKEPVHGCIGKDSAYVNVVPPLNLTYTVNPKELCAGKTATLQASGAPSFTWSSGEQSSTITFTPIPDHFTDTVIAMGALGCRTKLLINLPVSDKCKDVIPYNIVTPNGDGQNDIFYIDNIEAYRDNVVRIYSRWGQVLAEIKNYDNSNNYWSGTVFSGNKDNYNDIQNQNLPSGTYFYIIDLGDGTALIKGYIELVKK